MRVVLLALALFGGAAYAAGPADVMALLDQKKTAPEIVTAINSGTEAWRPRDVYALVDRKAPADVIKAAAAKAAVFYDGTNITSLDDQWKKGIAAVPEQKIDLKADADWAKFFAFYDQVKTEADAARGKSGSKPSVPNDGENEAAFDKRVRAWEESAQAALVPSEGKIDRTTFNVEVKFKPGAFDGTCYAPVTVKVDLSAYSFAQWRTAMGKAASTTLPIAKPSGKSNLADIKFTSDGGQRLEFTTTKLCPYEYADELAGRGAKLKIELKRTRKGDDWSLKGSVVDPASGEKIDAG